MTWFVEEKSTVGSGWSPAIYHEEPQIDEKMRIKKTGGTGPTVRRKPKKVLELDLSMSLADMQKKYGVKYIAPPIPITAIRPTRKPDFIIGGEENPYLKRWYLIPRNPEFNVYYHQIVRDDDDRALHDHPWASFSIMMKGQMREVTPEGPRIIEAGDCVFRAPEMAHRLELIDGQPAETLFITGPRVRDWGFHCPKGFVHWQDFVAANPGEVGRGCGEMSDAVA